jgi:hypothetical protein
MATGDPTWTELFGYRTAVAEWASIVALFVSAYAAVTIRSVRRQILGRVRLPALVSGIELNAKNLAKLMREYEENKDQVGLEVSVCATRLKLLLVSIKGPPKTSIRSILKQIRRYKGQSRVFPVAVQNSREDAWRLYESLNALIEELKHVLEDQRVGG